MFVQIFGTLNGLTVRHISQLALFRGIRIVPEFDTPGHSASFGVGYPQIMAECPNVAPSNRYMINPTKDETRLLVSSLLQVTISVCYYHTRV